eukprot:TRINITY_DN38108_c0_g1_i1.p1 TRINITY_DN38108_c0_g1~~TRINITY_DN38108_c0_g1_i1.p1  ORF type:complete len:159 (-),score=34.33 TRINITY_DN38108_c0_g1_i1:96-572(-)
MFFFFQAEDGIRDAQESRGLGDVYKRQGLDTEWAVGPDGSSRAVLLQLCDDQSTLLLRLPQCLPSPSLTALLRDRTCTVKAGVAVMKDAEMLLAQHGLLTQGCLDLRLPAAELQVHNRGKNGLQALTRAVLHRDLSKEPCIRCGDWEIDLLSLSLIHI